MRVAQYNKSDEREKPTTKNTSLTRSSFRFKGVAHSFTDKQKTKEFRTLNWLIRNIKQTFLSGKEKGITRNVTTMKLKKISQVKENIP